ncbi:MAG: hypothetical protein A3G20_05090 [Acidobacteria bacterium RIFCSPLOWO2_12_FULL_59_11]|nr:MAG: hypothetical protein A3G20_05090 [Acidobacteria bacterium RIFCSPLOWO2_12_FULL_59_11]
MLDKGFKPVALHTYTDAEGNALYWRIRAKHPETGNKWIRPMYRNGNGFELAEPKFEGGKPLYALHRIASNPDAVVWIVEGEQKADALNKLGMVATTSGGAQSAAAADWKPLRARAVRIWPDNDEPGKGYAGEVANILLSMGCPTSCVDVAKLGLGESEDVVDWLAAHPSATRADIETLPMLTPHPEDANAPASDPAGAEWPEPLPLVAKVEPEPYPLDALPDTIRAAVIEVQGFTKAPIPMVASSALAALSLAIQAHADVQRAEKLAGPVGLFLLTIADSGERKSTCDGFFTSAIRDYQEQQAEAAKPAIKDYEAAKGAWAARQAGVREKIKSLAKAEKPTNALERVLRDLEDEKPEAPRVPKLLRGDDTPENLAWVLSREWPSSGVLSSEAGIVLGAHGMGKDSIMRNLGLLNILWDGGTLSIGRRTSESFTVRGARLTMALQVQEATLRSFFDRSGGLARGTGFLARFLVSWPESTQGFRPFTDPLATWPHLAAYNRRIAAMLDQPAPIDDEGVLSPPMLSLAPEAKAAWIEYHNAIEGELASGGELYDVRDVASKSADNAARLAALFQIFEGAGGAIGADAFEGASRIAAWHLNESRRFFGELALPVELANAARLDSWLIEYCRRGRTHVVPIAKLQQGGPGGLRSKAIIETAMRELEEAGRARLVREGRCRIIKVNPALLIEGGAS